MASEFAFELRHAFIGAMQAGVKRLLGSVSRRSLIIGSPLGRLQLQAGLGHRRARPVHFEQHHFFQPAIALLSLRRLRLVFPDPRGALSQQALNFLGLRGAGRQGLRVAAPDRLGELLSQRVDALLARAALAIGVSQALGQFLSARLQPRGALLLQRQG